MAYLLDAYEHARKEAPDLSLVVAGYADEAWSKRLERPGVDFRGSLAYDELARLYDRAKLAVVPSIWPEPFPRSALEAAAAGVPVVGTASGGIPLIVEHRRTGLLVPPRDAHALAAAILELWQDETSARRLGLAASEHVKATFSAARIAALAETFYADVVSRKALPSAQSALA
jgi:glycosyltransferase involved in cell wall biosynthesis